MMVLNEDGVPCLRAGVWEVVGHKDVQVGTERKKHGRGYRNVPVFEKQPIEKQTIKLVPAKERGWKEEVVFEKPIRNNKTGQWQLWQYRVASDSFRCSVCKTSRYTMVQLMGWSYDKYPTLKYHGGGVCVRCFKCDITQGPIDESEYGEEAMIKDNITKKEAIEVTRKYGLDVAGLPILR